MPNFRTERDSLGNINVPADALYGASTQRAILNFPVSGYRMDRGLIRALGWIKGAAAQANLKLGRLTSEQAALICEAAREMVDGHLDPHFPVDVFQTGSGTSTNMNANEVLSNRCAQLAGTALGSKTPVHPNDHVNLGQSSNDVFPTAIHVAIGTQLQSELLPALAQLAASLAQKTTAFWEILKIGRTHLMDATPIRLGQVFSGYAHQLEQAQHRLRSAISALEELPLGGTAVGTGLNTHSNFAALVIGHLVSSTGISWRETANHFDAQAAKDALVETSSQLKTIAISLFKIANDIRWLGSGPRCGLGELQLPATQPGSSIMPGKVNPVMCESLMQVCTRVIGNDATVSWAAATLSNFELNVGMPVTAHALGESTRLLTNSCHLFRARCIDGLTANEARCTELVELSLAMVTSLVPLIGYDRAATIAKECATTGKTVRQVCREQAILPEAELARVLTLIEMTHPSGISPDGL